MISTVKILVPVIFISVLTPSIAEKADDFVVIKGRVVAELMKTGVDDDRVAEVLARMNKDGSFQGINYTDLSRTAGFPHRRHTSNLVYLAKAYKTKKSILYKN